MFALSDVGGGDGSHCRVQYLILMVPMMMIIMIMVVKIQSRII